MPSVNVSGLNLFYTDDDFVDPWKPRETVFMQHYVLGNGGEYRGWVPTLARDYRVIRMDRRGWGGSEAPPFGYQYAVPDLIEDFVGFLDAMRIERVHYVGNSLGGLLGVYFAVAHPERLHSLTLVSTPCFIRDSVGQSLNYPGYASPMDSVMDMGSWRWAYGRQARPRSPESTSEDVLKALYLAEQTARIPAHVIASVLRMVTAPDFNITAILPRVQAPTLLLSPGVSPQAPLDEQELMLNEIPHCEQVIFEGTPHMITWDIPEQCAKATLEFIRRHGAGAALVP